MYTNITTMTLLAVPLIMLRALPNPVLDLGATDGINQLFA
jgi:hypothetical protein